VACEPPVQIVQISLDYAAYPTEILHVHPKARAFFISRYHAIEAKTTRLSKTTRLYGGHSSRKRPASQNVKVCLGVRDIQLRIRIINLQFGERLQVSNIAVEQQKGPQLISIVVAPHHMIINDTTKHFLVDK